MATRNVNLISAIARTIPRTARATTSIVRIGWVLAAASGPKISVNVGGQTKSLNYLKNAATAAIGDQVAILVTADSWLVIGVVAK